MFVMKSHIDSSREVLNMNHTPHLLSFTVLLEQALCSSSVQCSWKDMYFVKIALLKVPIGDSI